MLRDEDAGVRWRWRGGQICAEVAAPLRRTQVRRLIDADGVDCPDRVVEVGP